VSARAAPISPEGPAAVAVIEVTGPGARDALGRTFSRRGGRRALPDIGRAALGVIESSDGSPADEVLLLRLAEDRFEVDGHGGRGARERVLDALLAQGALQALPSRGITPAAAPLPSPVARARTWLGVRVASWVEAGLVAPDHPVARRLLGAPARVVLAGLPNAGKSALLNALLERSRALVSPEAGTTRDVLEEETALVGVPIALCDTAGVDDLDGGGGALAREPETHREVAREAEARARDAAASADLLLLCVDGSAPIDAALEARMAAIARDPRALAVATKADLPFAWEAPASALRVSSTSGDGLPALARAIATRLLGVDPDAILGPAFIAPLPSGGTP